jgi:hypothetical protein
MIELTQENMRRARVLSMKEVVQLPFKHQPFPFPLYTGQHTGLGQMSQAGRLVDFLIPKGNVGQTAQNMGVSRLGISQNPQEAERC